MHLFLLDLYISLDTLAPIIDTLNPKKVIICNVNPIQDYKKDKLLKYLLGKKIRYYNFIPISKKKKFIYNLIKFLSLMPCKLQKKFQFFYDFVYYRYQFSSKNLIKNFLIENSILSVSYETSTRSSINEFYEACKELKVPLVNINNGLDFDFVKPTINNQSVKYCDYYIVANNIKKKDIGNMNFKVKCLGSARYSLHWLKRLKGSIFLQRPQKDNSKIRIGIFTKGDGIEENEILKLANKLKQMSNIEIEIRNKPRDIRPMKCSSFGLDEMSTTEMIDWADIIISSRPSSVLFEAVVKEKPIILPEYIYKEINQCLIINYDFIKIAKNEDELLNLIKRCNQKNYDYKNKKEFLNRFSFDFDKESQIPKNFENFYQKVKE